MKKILCFLTLMSIVSLATAATYDITVTPEFVTDTAAPLGNNSDFAPGFGDGCIQANGTAKTALVLDLESIFGNVVKVSDLASISYYTKKNTSYSVQAADWYVEMYTKADGVDDDSWYGRRINSEPYLTGSITEGQWNQFSTDEAAAHRMRFFDANREGVGYGSYVDPFLSDLTSGEISWSDYWANATETVDYRQEEIWFMAVSTGSGWANGFDGLVDGMVIELTNGDVANLNFEPVPEPATMALLGLGGLLLRRKRS